MSMFNFLSSANVPSYIYVCKQFESYICLYILIMLEQLVNQILNYRHDSAHFYLCSIKALKINCT
jgi:hypothetical protein